MTIAPIVHTVEVKTAPARAFQWFTGQMGRWWPSGMTVGKSPHVAIVVEPHVGGAWLERAADGAECRWGTVLIWEPPTRLVLAWQLNDQFAYDPDLITEVELTFAAAGAGTLVTLEHRNLERFGVDAEKVVGQLGGGWLGILKAYANTASTPQS